MKVTTIHPSQLLDYLTNLSPAVRMGTDRSEVRMLSGVVDAIFVYQLLEPALYIFLVKDSMTHRVAGLLGAHWLIGGLFFLAAAALLPKLFVVTFRPELMGRKLPRRLAACAAVTGAFVWGLMAVMSLPVDAAWLTTVFSIRCAVDFGFGMLYGISLNAQHAKETKETLERMKAREAFQYAEQEQFD